MDSNSYMLVIVSMMMVWGLLTIIDLRQTKQFTDRYGAHLEGNPFARVVIEKYGVKLLSMTLVFSFTAFLAIVYVAFCQEVVSHRTLFLGFLAYWIFMLCLRVKCIERNATEKKWHDRLEDVFGIELEYLENPKSVKVWVDHEKFREFMGGSLCRCCRPSLEEASTDKRIGLDCVVNESFCEVVETLVLDWECPCGCRGRTSIDRIGETQCCLGCERRFVLTMPKRACCVCQRPSTRAHALTNFGFCEDQACFDEYVRQSKLKTPRDNQLMATCEH